MALGGTLAAIPYLSDDADMQSWIAALYWTSITALVLSSILCFLFARTVTQSRAETIADIKDDLDTMLNSYGP